MAACRRKKRSKPGCKKKSRPDLELDYHLLRGNTGFTACEFIQSSGADLVVMPSQMPSAYQPVFAPALDWIIQVIPANLWVIRQTVNKQTSSGYDFFAAASIALPSSDRQFFCRISRSTNGKMPP